MSAQRLFAVMFIYGCTAMAWAFLGGSVVQRSGEADEGLARQVAQLWGGHHEQFPPEVWVERPGEEIETVQEKDDEGNVTTRKVARQVVRHTALALDSGRLEMALHLEPRRKGLLWYDTWTGEFEGRYSFQNPDDESRRVGVRFPFPSAEAIYDGFRLRLNGQDLTFDGEVDAGASVHATLPPHGRGNLEVVYSTRGLGPWLYGFAPKGVARVRDFQLDLSTDFGGLDFPPGTLSPTTFDRTPGGQALSWRFESLVTGQKIGVDPPDRLNPGPFVARVTFFAPAALLFFMAVLVILGLVQGPSLHPMHWFFLSAAFFSFHLLLAYLVDHVVIHVAFLISAVTSVFLVVSYLRLVAGMRFAVLRAGLAQAVFLVLFSYAFFLEGYTGLTVTVGAVITLFVLMQVTGRVDWTQALGGTPGEKRR